MQRGVAAPHQCPLESVASYLIHADVRSILTVLWQFKGTFLSDQQYRTLWQGVVAEVLGTEAAAATTWDGFKIRAQPPAQFAQAWDGKCLLGPSALHAGRSTGGSQIFLY